MGATKTITPEELSKIFEQRLNDLRDELDELTSNDAPPVPELDDLKCRSVLYDMLRTSTIRCRKSALIISNIITTLDASKRTRAMVIAESSFVTSKLNSNTKNRLDRIINECNTLLEAAKAQKEAEDYSLAFYKSSQYLLSSNRLDCFD